MLPLKTVIAVASAFFAGMGLTLTIHSQLIVPAIMREVVREIDLKIQQHRDSGVHPGAVLITDYSRDRVELLAALEKLATRESVAAISAKIDALHGGK